MSLTTKNLTANNTTTPNNFANSYLVTGSTGQLKLPVSSTSVTFPIGSSTSKHNPISVTNSGTTDTYGFNVKAGVADTSDINYMVNYSWVVTEATLGGGNLRVVPQWPTNTTPTDVGTNFSVGADFIELYNDSPLVTFLPASITTAAPFTATLTNATDNFSNTLSGINYFAVAKHKAQEIDVLGKNISIVSGDVTPSTADDTDFGNVALGSSAVTKTYTVKNTGQLPLSVTGIAIAGDADFTLANLPSSYPKIITGGGSITFDAVFAPSTAGVKNAPITIGNNDSNENPYTFAIQGNATFDCVATTAATDIDENSFTANWNANSEATGYVIDVYKKTIQNASDMFISEYVHAGSNNKYIEIYNGTGATVDLSGYRLRIYANGSVKTLNPQTDSDVQLSGSLLNNSVIVLKNSGADLTLNTGVTATINNAVNFNGDDALALYKISTTSNVDVFGRIGNDPGAEWTGGGGYSTLSKTLVRKANVSGGVTVNPTGTGSEAFTTLTTEWDLYNSGTVSNLGGHTYNATVFTYVLQNYNVGNVNTFNIQGLDTDTDYYYRVRAVNNGVQSGDTCGETKVTTKAIIWDGIAWSNIIGPTIKTKARIEGPYITGNSTLETDFSANKLTVQAIGSLDITAGHTITVVNELINKLTVNKVMIESDGNLIQKTDLPITANTGAISARREITIKDNDQYNYLISPLIGSNLKTNLYENQTTHVLSSALSTLYHNETNNKFYNSIGTYIPGRGLAVMEPAAAVVTGGGKINAFFSGTPMNGAFMYPLSNSATSLTGYNLVGNPYPSNIDILELYQLGSNTTNISQNFYFWDNTANSETVQLGNAYNGAAYAVYNAVSETGNGTGFPLTPGTIVSSRKPTNIVKVGQGFMVRSIETTAKTLAFKNSIRIGNGGNGYFGYPLKGQNPPARNRFWVNLSAPSTITTQVAIVYLEAGTDEFSKDDSEMNGLPSDVLFTVVGDRKAVINGRAPFVNTDIIPLGSNGFASGNYTFSLDTTEGIFTDGQNIYLKDKLTGILTNLSEGNYIFQGNAGETVDRFEIIYKPEVVLVTDNAIKEGVLVYRHGSDFVIRSPKIISTVEIYDFSGKLVSVLRPNSKQAIFDSSRLVNGMYVLKIKTVNGEVISKKIIR